MTASPGETATLSSNLLFLRPILIGIFALAVPLMLVSSNVRWLTEDRGLYLAGFAKYEVGKPTGLSDEQLARVADAFLAYFRGAPGRLDITVTAHGQSRPLFNEREIAHMQDVQAIVHAFQRLQVLSVLAMAVVAAVGFALWQRAFAPSLAWAALLGAAITLVLLGLIGLLATLDFQSLFVRFHLVSFQNDLWMLDPTQDYLIMLFPLGFWYDATVRLALMIAVEATLIGAAGYLVLRLGGGAEST
jgi:integral membrane protein (TIGR01906 family)